MSHLEILPNLYYKGSLLNVNSQLQVIPSYIYDNGGFDYWKIMDIYYIYWTGLSVCNIRILQIIPIFDKRCMPSIRAPDHTVLLEGPIIMPSKSNRILKGFFPRKVIRMQLFHLYSVLRGATCT